MQPGRQQARTTFAPQCGKSVAPGHVGLVMLIAGAVSGVQPRAHRRAAVWASGFIDRVVAGKTRARRRWAVRTGLILGASGVLLFGLLVWRYDTSELNSSLWNAERLAESIQTHLDRTGLLPGALPADLASGFAYASYADRFYAERADRPCIVATSPHVALSLRPNGCSAIVYTHGQVQVQWMTNAELVAAYATQQREAEEFDRRRFVRSDAHP